MLDTVKGYLLLGSAIVACPCHLPLTLGLLAGTSLGGFFSENAGLLALGLGGYFILALVLGFRYLQRTGGQSSGAARPSGGNPELECKDCEDTGLLRRVLRNGVHQGEAQTTLASRTGPGERGTSHG